MATKYQIFVSSTYEDLREEREQVIKAILEMGHIPVGMEMFSAADETQWRLIQRQIDQSDYYIVIMAHRYGSMDDGVSYTEKEYNYAVGKQIPTLAFLLEDGSPWIAEYIDKDADKVSRLTAFKIKAKQRMVSFWQNKDDLYGKCSVALMKAMASNPRIGWIRADEVAGPEVTNEITRLSSENAKLRKLLDAVKIAEKENQERKLQEVIEVLSKNERKTFVWKKGAKDWGDPLDTNLLNIFTAISVEALNEASVKNLNDALALAISGNIDYIDSNPIPINYLQSWLADLASLELVQPSDKKHSLKDTNEYWMLTSFGIEVSRNLRRVLLGAATIKSEQTAMAPEGKKK